MDALLIYTVKSAGLLLLFAAAYYLLLRRETFFSANRFFLLGGLVVSIGLPLVTFTKIIWETLQPTQAQTIPQTVAVVLPQSPQPEHGSVDWWLVLAVAYVAGALFFAIQFVLDYYAVRSILAGKVARREGRLRIVEIDAELPPFSYFNTIAYNPSHYSQTELDNILEHEKAHCREYHSIDVLFARLCCVVFWFNPLIWFYKTQIVQNLEFIADATANTRITDRKSYQLTLLKVTARENRLAFTNHFYQSLIKKRIVMLNKKQSRKVTLWKYAVVIPALALFMLQFQVKVVAQTKMDLAYTKTSSGKQPKAPAATKIPAVAGIDYDLMIEKKFFPSDSDKQIGEDLDRIRNVYGLDVILSNVKRNSAGQINYITAVAKYPGHDLSPQKYATASEDKINPFRLLIYLKAGAVVDYKFEAIAENSEVALPTETKEPADETVALPADASRNMLLIIDGKEIMADDLKDYTVETDGYITQLDAEEGVKKYGSKAKNGVLIFSGKVTYNKKTPAVTVASEPKIVKLANGDQVVFMAGPMMKLPGYPSIKFSDTQPELFINGVKYYNPGETISGMDLDRIKSIQLMETIDPKTKQKSYNKVLMQLK